MTTTKQTMPKPIVRKRTLDIIQNNLTAAGSTYEKVEKEIEVNSKGKEVSKTYLYFTCKCGKENVKVYCINEVTKPGWYGMCKECFNNDKVNTSKSDQINQAIEHLKSHNAVFQEVKRVEQEGKETYWRIYFICSCGSNVDRLLRVIYNGEWNGSCNKCINEKNGSKHTLEHAQKVWADAGEILPDQPYISNKHKLYYTHSRCGKTAHMSLHEFNHGRRCENCCRDRAEETNKKKYGAENMFATEYAKNKIKETNMERHGVEHHMQVPEILEKAKTTNMEKIGVPFAFHTEEAFTKGRATNMENLGVEYPLQSQEIQDKCDKTFLEKYGVRRPLQSSIIQDKIENVFLLRYGMSKTKYLQKLLKENKDEYNINRINTCLEKYGVKNVMHVPEFFEKMVKSCYKIKTFTFPSGRVENCQGYEPRCFEYLLQKYNEDDIEVGYKNRPALMYSNPVNDKESRYYPDGFIKSENAIIEVKSDYFYFKDIEKNLAKFYAVTKAGYRVFLYVFDGTSLVYEKVFTQDSTFDVLHELAVFTPTTFTEQPPEQLVVT